MNNTILPFENRIASTDTIDTIFPGLVSSHRLMSFSIISDLRKSEEWAEFRKKFVGIGIHDRIIDSLALVPLVETALDDGVISQEDINKILFTMKNIGLLTTGIDPKLRDLWLPFKGRTTFLIVWTVYLRDLSRQMLPEEKTALKTLIIESCKFMIRTIGGFLKTNDLDDRIMVAIDCAFAFDTVSLKDSDQFQS